MILGSIMIVLNIYLILYILFVWRQFLISKDLYDPNIDVTAVPMVLAIGSKVFMQNVCSFFHIELIPFGIVIP